MKQSLRNAILYPLGIAAAMAPAFLLAAGGNQQGFDAVVRSVESRYGIRSHHIPFLGLVSLAAGVSTHGGVRNLHLAEFDNVTTPIDGDELNKIVEQHVGQGWQRIVRETSRNGGEQSLIFVHPEGNHLGMLVVDLDGHELNLVQLSIDPDRLDSELNQRTGKHHHIEADEAQPEDTPEPEKPASASE